MNDQSTLCADCGADYSPAMPKPGTGGGSGYATIAATGARVCYPCAAKREAADVLAACNAPTKDSRIQGYLSGDSGAVHLTSWTGHPLPLVGRVTACTRIPRGAPGSHWSSHRVSVCLTAPNGAQWIGRGYGKGMSILLRPNAATLQRARDDEDGNPWPDEAPDMRPPNEGESLCLRPLNDSDAH